MRDPILEAFLRRQLDEGLALAASSDLLGLTPVRGHPPTHYMAEFRCKGLVQDPRGEVCEFDRWLIGIAFPDDYLRAAAHASQVLTYFGPAPTPFHPNVMPPFVCLDISAGLPLVTLLYGLYDLLTWNLYATHDEGLNHAASQWARRQGPARFPVDRRPLKRRDLRLNVGQASPEVAP